MAVSLEVMMSAFVAALSKYHPTTKRGSSKMGANSDKAACQACEGCLRSRLAALVVHWGPHQQMTPQRDSQSLAEAMTTPKNERFLKIQHLYLFPVRTSHEPLAIMPSPQRSRPSLDARLNVVV